MHGDRHFRDFGAELFESVCRGPHLVVHSRFTLCPPKTLLDDSNL
jgi:hypothetical protein